MESTRDSTCSAELAVRFAAWLEAVGAENLTEAELDMAVELIEQFEPGSGGGPHCTASFQRRAVVREWLADPTNALSDARALLNAHEPQDAGQENRAAANVPSARERALQRAEGMPAAQLFELLDPLVCAHADRLPAVDLRAVARAVSRELRTELPSTANQQIGRAHV